jgi:glycine oxidase
MLAPAFEALLDPVSAEHFPILAAARMGWADLADSLPAGQTLIDRSGALYFAKDDADLRRRAERLAAFDPSSEILGAAQAQALSAGLRAPGPGLFSALDWRLEPGATLAALHKAFLQEGGAFLAQAVDRQWRNGADVLVLATGADAMPVELPESGLLTPIKGHILRFEKAGPGRGPVVRAPGVYVAPVSGGAAVGATMQAGRSDREIEAGAVAELREAGAQLFPQLIGSSRPQVGIRAATPDGLPLAGPSGGDARIFLAAGARRNGWLLAPAIADVIAARLRGLESGAFGAAFDPGRFAIR